MTEIVHFDTDITAWCCTAESFPAGVLAAHQQLHALVQQFPGRRYFGISYPMGPGNIIYHAATESAPGEDAESLGCDVFFIKKGDYLSLLVPDFMDDLPAIGRAFQELLQDPRIDPEGYCLEWYINDRDVRCMVLLQET